MAIANARPRRDDFDNLDSRERTTRLPRIVLPASAEETRAHQLHTLTPDLDLRAVDATGTKDIATLKLARDYSVFVHDDIEPALTDPVLAADWLVADLNAIAYNAPVWASGYEDVAATS